MKKQTLEQLWVIIGHSVILSLSAFLVFALAESGSEHGECRKLGDVQYRPYNSGEVINLGPCPHSCEDYVWVKETPPIVHQPHGNRGLQLTITAETGGSYCCKCREHPHRSQCCYGVAGQLTVKQWNFFPDPSNPSENHFDTGCNLEWVRPKVEFKIVQFGEQTATICTNVSVLVECNVTGYPFPVLRTHGPENGIVFEMKFNDTNPYEGRLSWSAVYRVEIPPERVTHNLSGNYSCTGEVNFRQNGVKMSEDSTVSLDVTTYAEPRVVAHCQGPTKGNLTLVCTVDSSAPYSLSWLCGGTNITAQNNTKSVYHAFRNQSGHFLVVTGASKQDLRKDYTCVVTTAFRQTARHFYCSSSGQSDTGLPGHNNPSSFSPLGVAIFLLGVAIFLSGLLGVGFIVVWVCRNMRRKLINWPRELGTSIRSPLEPNEQTDSEADKKRSPADEERPSSEEPGQQDLRRRTGIS